MESKTELRPAFDNDRQAAGFLLLLAVALVSPIPVAHFYHGDRQHIYRVMRDDVGTFPWTRAEIFDVKDDIDILFVGNSTVWAGFASPLVEEALTRQLGRRARVVTYGSSFSSIDVLYMEVRDTLEHKSVHMVVSAIPRFHFNDGPSPVTSRFVSYGDPPETTEGLPFRYRPLLYADYILRTPRDVLDLFRPFGKYLFWLAGNHGSLMAERGWEHSAFSRFTPRPLDLPADALIYSPQRPDSYEYTGEPLPPYQDYYLRKLSGLLKEKHIKFVLANMPAYPLRLHTKPTERQCWPSVLGKQVAMVGIAPPVLFRGLTGDQVKKLFYDNEHLNLNGCTLLTHALMPALLELYHDPNTQ